MNHRGRFQAQGKQLEKSRSWAQEEPLSIVDGRSLLTQLEAALTDSERKIRAEPLVKCREAIEQMHVYGGYDVSASGRFMKSYVAKGTASERVDLEIHKGIAFN